MTPMDGLKESLEKCAKVIKQCGEALKKLSKPRSHMAVLSDQQRAQRKKKKKKRQQKRKSR